MKKVERGEWIPPPKPDFNQSAYQKSPALYMKEQLGMNLTLDQHRICDAVMNNPRVLVKASHGIGKSYLAAGLALWHYDSFAPSRTITTAPTIGQVKKIIWGTMRSLAGPRPDFMPSAPLLQDHPDHFAEGTTARDDNSFQGEHSNHMFIIFDEAVGIKKQFWDAARGMLTGIDSKWLCICNPTDTTSAAYAADLDQSNQWFVMSVSALDHPNIAEQLAGRPPIIPAATTLEYIFDSLREWCIAITPNEVKETDIEFPPGSNKWYRPGPSFESRVLGRWPSSSDYSVWSSGIWEMAITADLEMEIDGDIQIGCDPGYTTDYTSIHIRRGPISLYHETKQGYDTSTTAQRLKDLADQWGPKYGVEPKEVKIKIDTGGLGIGVWDQRGSYRFLAVNSSGKATQQERYPNKRSELWFVTAERAKEQRLDLSNLQPEQLKKMRPQFFAPRWSTDAQGRLKVEPKDVTKARIGRSPDDADAVNLAYYDSTVGNYLGSPIVIGARYLPEHLRKNLPQDMIDEENERLKKQGPSEFDWRNQLPVGHHMRKGMKKF